MYEEEPEPEELDLDSQELGAAIIGMWAAIHLLRKQEICPYFVLKMLIHYLETKEVGIDIPTGKK